MNRIYGYARVSSKEQNEDRQIISLKNFGVDQIFVDQQSGKDFNRPQYKKLLRKIKSGDTLVVKSIDRLGRNYAEILEQWRVITKDKRAAIVVIDMPILDTRESKDIIGTLIADLVLQIMSAFAQIERDFIKQRQAEGIAAAKARGVKFGRQPLSRPDNYDEIVALWKAGKISGRKAAKLLGVSNYTFIRWIRCDANK
ncbi:MAG: recombinase family protein [Selenomonadaceae bacterium]|nr:recombinase family protein [Selenomonadaceae bacterium]